MHQQKKIDGIADDETTAASIAVYEPKQRDNNDTDAMSDKRTDDNLDIQEEQSKINNITMTDKDHTTTNTQQQQETTTNKITKAMAAGDFTHQFNNNQNSINTIDISTPTGVNRQ
jgi:uncharacterized Ntn-hydrolase superfamily protein